VTPGDWHAAAHRLNDILDARQLAEVQGIQQRVRRTDGNGFTWVRPARAASVTAAAGLPAAWTAAVPDSAGGDLALIIEGICGGLDDGSLTGGDLLSSRSLARRTGMTPGRAAECLTQLAAEAIIDQRGSDYLLPAPVALDVVETYTARGLLGTAIVRRLAATGATVPAVVDGLLDRIEVCHDLGLTHEAYKLDLEVQDELARTAAMPRIGWMFVQLTLQLRLFTKVLGLQYQYPVAEIITDDRRIVDEIRCKDPAAAVDAWRSKVDNCADYMLRTIEASPYRR
jgi:DNA-binding GntR family transcriptional regulator